MKHRLIIGASGGIGQALAQASHAQGWQVTGLSRSRDGLDVTDEASIERSLSGVTSPVTSVLIAIGALEINGAAPEKSLRNLTAQAMNDQFAVNTIGPALVIKHALPLIPRDTDSQIAVLTARVGSIGDNRLGGWYSYRAAKAAANQVVHTAAIEIARTHPRATVVALHPGTVQTAFTRKYLGRHPAVPPQEAAENLLSVLEGLTPQHTGRFFDYAGQEVPW